MSEQSDVTQNVPDPVAETVNRIPASDPAPARAYGPGNRFLTKDKTVHQLLGGGRGKPYTHPRMAQKWFMCSVAVVVCVANLSQLFRGVNPIRLPVVDEF
jgi:hypothetical protein